MKISSVKLQSWYIFSQGADQDGVLAHPEVVKVGWV